MNKDKSILDRSKYSSKTIDTFQLIGAYIVDIYYNHLYIEAVKFKNSGKVSSIAEGYRHAIYAFLEALNVKSKSYKLKYYTRLLEGIQEYFTTWTSFSTLTIGDCVNKITEEFVPSDYYKSLDMDNKRNIMRVVLTQTIKEFSRIVTQEYLVLVIDYHDNQDNITIFKDKMIDCLLLQREQMYQNFLDTKIGKSDTVNKGLAEKMQQELKSLYKEKEKYDSTIKELKNDLHINQSNTKLLLDKYKELFKKYKALKEENDNFKNSRRDISSEKMDNLLKSHMRNTNPYDKRNDYIDNSRFNTMSNNAMPSSLNNAMSNNAMPSSLNSTRANNTMSSLMNNTMSKPNNSLSSDDDDDDYGLNIVTNSKPLKSDSSLSKSDSSLSKSDSKLTKSNSKLSKTESNPSKTDSKLTKSDSKLPKSESKSVSFSTKNISYTLNNAKKTGSIKKDPNINDEEDNDKEDDDNNNKDDDNDNDDNNDKYNKSDKGDKYNKGDKGDNDDNDNNDNDNDDNDNNDNDNDDNDDNDNKDVDNNIDNKNNKNTDIAKNSSSMRISSILGDEPGITDMF